MDLDVTELLGDPTFVDPIQVIDRVSEINSLGENILRECRSNGFGSVQPAPNKVILRVPEALRVQDLKAFWIKGKISIVASEPGKYTAVLVSQNRRFNVQMIFDWSLAGAGWCEGVCIAERPAP